MEENTMESELLSDLVIIGAVTIIVTIGVGTYKLGKSIYNRIVETKKKKDEQTLQMVREVCADIAKDFEEIDSKK